MIHFGRFGLCLLTVFTIGCKPLDQDSETSVKSLDNFASGANDQNKNFCKGPSTNKNPLGKKIGLDRTIDSSLRPVLITSLSAVPDKVQKFFIDGGGRVKVDVNTNRVCSQRFSDVGSRQFLSQKDRSAISACVVIDAASKKVTIMLAPDGKEIAHNVVRMFGFMFGQVYAKGGGAVPETAGMFALKKNLANAFLKDILTVKAFTLEPLKGLLGGDAGLNRIYSNFKSGAPDLLSGVAFSYNGTQPTAEQQSIRAQRFKDFVFAEAFDSFYCDVASKSDATRMTALVSKLRTARSAELASLREKRRTLLKAKPRNTLTIMKTFFPNSHNLFAVKVVPQINSFVAGSKSSGLGLTGRGFASLFPSLFGGGAAGAPSGRAWGFNWGNLFSIFKARGFAQTQTATCATNPTSSG